MSSVLETASGHGNLQGDPACLHVYDRGTTYNLHAYALGETRTQVRRVQCKTD
jgi:hypothetical protein